MNTLKLHVTNSVKSLNSKAGKPFTITTGFVFLPGQPYPSEIGLMNVPAGFPEGLYEVGIRLSIYQGRLSLDFDYSTAKKVEK